MKKIKDPPLSGMVKDGSHISQKEKQAMFEHLEKKYGEKFFVEKVVVPPNEAMSGFAAFVYPKGKKSDLFLVNTSGKDFVDDYVLLLQGKRMLPLYEKWIQSIIPSAKISISVMMGSRQAGVIYDPDETPEQFVSGNDGLYLGATIVLSEAMLENKDDTFGKLSKIPEAELISGYTASAYTINFYTQATFDHMECEYGPMYDLTGVGGDCLLKDSIADLVATTSFVKGGERDTLIDTLKQLNMHFKKREEA